LPKDRQILKHAETSLVGLADRRPKQAVNPPSATITCPVL
jgi:hypothetical protein